MRRLIIVLFIVFSISGMLLADPLTVTFTPPTMSLNVLNAAAFDPVNPQNQPFLTNLRIQNTSSTPVNFRLHLILKWNNSGNPLLDIMFPSLNPINPGEQWNLSNRDLITDQQSQYFGETTGDISLDQVMNSNPILQSALESGNFPDGTLNFIVSTVQTNNTNLLSNTATFVISVTNVTSIFLTYPGKPVGQNPPKVNLKPVTFLWNAMTTNINTFHMVIKEFAPGSAPNANSVGNAGRIVFNEDVGNNMFDGFLPFQSNHFYAWQISTALYTEANFPGSDNPSHLALSSQWYVFQFDDSQGGNETGNQEITAILNMLNDPAINGLFNTGYMPTGVVIFEGQVYTGQDALDLINSLVGKNLQIEIKEQ